jgi:hypothetical protein
MTGSMHPWREVVGPATWRMMQQAAAWPARFGKRHGGEPTRVLPRFDLAIAVDEKSLYRRRDTAPNDDDEAGG